MPPTHSCAVGGVLERQAFEVHAVDAGDGERGNGDGAEDGEDLHDFVGAVGDRGEIDVEGVVEQVALGFDGVEETGDVVVGVADVGLVVGVDDGVGVALEMKRGVAGVDEDAAEIDELALDGEDAIAEFRARGCRRPGLRAGRCGRRSGRWRESKGRRWCRG